MQERPIPRWILPLIVVAQFCCTSLWFAGNAVLPELAKTITVGTGFLANLTSAVQFGFIAGTLVFALMAIADKYSPSKVFFACSIIAAACNLVITINSIPATALFASRLLTGFFLAGIYPVGMKIAADYYGKGLGRSLGFLVGALVLGTAFPHFLKTITTTFPWKYIIYSISLLSIVGGMMIYLLVPDGPLRKRGQRLKLSFAQNAFSNIDFRSAAFGYFGHMWELYAFWAFVPVMLRANEIYNNRPLNISMWSFIIIAVGSIACVFSGLLSRRFCAKSIATISLILSGSCCLLSPLFIMLASDVLLITFLILWGMVVIADSPLFSSLVAQNAPEESRGTYLTIVNCIGFSITIISIQLLKWLSSSIDSQYLYMILAIGPVLGVIALRKN